MIASLSVTACATDAADATDEPSLDESTAAVVGGTHEADYLEPWVVSLDGCGGTLIHPSWVLTAAHCIPPGLGGWSQTVRFSRRDPYTGVVTQGLRYVDTFNAQFIHPQYVAGGGLSAPKNDIALVKLHDPVPIDGTLQTAALPSAPPIPNQMGQLVNSGENFSTATYSVYRGPISATPITGCTIANGFCVHSTNAAAACDGDGGSGFITQINGRATVTGVASFMNTVPACTYTNNSYIAFADVYGYKSWILSTINMSEAELAGNTRIRWSGTGMKGKLDVSCPGFASAPTYVAGVEAGLQCTGPRTVSCTASPLKLGDGITSFTMKMSGSVVSLPFTSTHASYTINTGFTPTLIEFTCGLGSSPPPQSP